MAAGGSTGHILTKASGTDFETEWTPVLPIANGGTGGNNALAGLRNLGGITKYNASFGDTTNTVYTITHNLGRTGVVVELFLSSNNETIKADVYRISSSQIRVEFGSPPGAGAIQVIVLA